MNEEYVVSVVCPEPNGPVERRVRRMSLSLSVLDTFYTKAKEFRTLFNDDIAGDFKKFLEAFLSMDSNGAINARGLLFTIDNPEDPKDFIGVYYITDIHEHEATVHYSFFDRRHRGRKELTLAMIEHVFDKYRFHRLNVEVAAYAGRYIEPFVQELGFKFEGEKRSAILYRDKWYNLKLYSLLREEFETWDQRLRKSEAEQAQDLQTIS